MGKSYNKTLISYLFSLEVISRRGIKGLLKIRGSNDRIIGSILKETDVNTKDKKS